MKRKTSSYTLYGVNKLIVLLIVLLIIQSIFIVIMFKSDMEHIRQLRMSQLELEIKSVEIARKEVILEDNYTELEVCSTSSFKSYMDYHKITYQPSEQYKLQQKSYTDEQGFRRYGDYYLIALGSYYSTNVGDRFKIEFADGQVIQAMVGDLKSDSHTNACTQLIDNSMVEFIVDTQTLDSVVKNSGNIGLIFKGRIDKIYKEKENGI